MALPVGILDRAWSLGSAWIRLTIIVGRNARCVVLSRLRRCAMLSVLRA